MLNGKLKLKDFDFKNIGGWPPMATYVAVGVVGLIVFIIGFLLIDLSQYSQLSQAQQQEADAKLKLTTLIPQMLGQQAHQSQFNQLKTLMTQKSSSLAKPADLSAILSALTQFAANNQLKISLLKPESVIQEDYYAKIPISIVAKGSYQHLVSFLNELAHYNYYLYVSKLRIFPVNTLLAQSSNDQDGSSETLQLEASVDVYYASLKPKAEDKNAKKD